MALPHTLTRLSQSLSLIAMHQTGDSGLPIDLNAADLVNAAKNPLSTALNLADWAASVKPIGATWSFKVSQTRDNYERRGMNSSVEAFALVPGVQKTTISMDRAVLYLQDAMAAFNFVPGNMACQTRPLMIIESIAQPGEDEDGVGLFDPAKGALTNLGLQKLFKSTVSGMKKSFNLQEATPIVYLGCWINQSEISYNIKEGDQMVIQNITLDVAKVVQPLSLVPIVGAELQGTLAENVGILKAIGLGGLSPTNAASKLKKVSPFS